MVARLYFVMFSTFWLLYLQSFVPDLFSANEAKALYAKVMIASVVVGLLFTPFIGKAVDTVNPKIVLPLAFFFRGLSVAMFLFVKDPRGIYSYVCGVLMVIGTSCQAMTCDTILFRIAKKEIRGTLYGVSVGAGFIGQFLFTLMGGFLVDYVSPVAPFAAVGIIDFLFGTTTIFLGWCGYIKNDIAIRRRKEFEVKETLRAMRKEN